MLKIKSRYIINLIFENISEEKYLRLIKYNKKIQNILDKSLKDYKEYNQIEIELIPISNYKNEDKFINRLNKDKSFIHIYLNIYFNNYTNNYKRREFNCCRLESKTKISRIRIIIDNEIKSLKGLFKNCECLEEINIIKCKRKDINDMSEIFYGCKNLNKLNLLNLKTDKVTDMSYMFSECSSLKSIDLSNFNTSNVTNMQNMFEKCSNLIKCYLYE